LKLIYLKIEFKLISNVLRKKGHGNAAE